MSELKRRASGPTVKTRGDEPKHTRGPARSASIKTEMAKIAYRDQQQKQQTVEGDAVDRSLDATGQALHRAASVPKAIRQQMVYQRQQAADQSYPRKKPITVDYMDFSLDEPTVPTLHHQPSQVGSVQGIIRRSTAVPTQSARTSSTPMEKGRQQAIRQLQGNLLRKRSEPNQQAMSNAARDIPATPQQRMQVEGMKTIQRRFRGQAQKRMVIISDDSVDAQTESARLKPSKPLAQLNGPTRHRWNPSFGDTQRPEINFIDSDTAISVPTTDTDASVPLSIAQSHDSSAHKGNPDQRLKRAVQNRNRVRAAGEQSVEIHKAAKAEIHIAGSLSPRTALRNHKKNATAKDAAATHFRRRSQQSMAAKAVTTKHTVKKRTIAVLKAAAQAMVKSVKSIFGAMIGAGASVLAPLIVIILIGALLCGPLGLFFTGESENELTLQQAMTQLNMEFSDKITEIENSVPHDSMRQDGHRAIWKDILTVYAVKTTTEADNSMDVVTMDAAHLEVLRNIFWDMNAIAYSTESYTETESVEVEVEGEDGEMHTETQVQTVEKTRLVIQISGKTAVDMALEYDFTPEQIGMVAELLSEEYTEFWSMMSVPGVGSNDIVEVALSQVGNVGGQPYWSWYGFPYRVAWCACFVSWCGDQCGYLDAGIIPRHSLVDDGIYWFQVRGQWQDRYYLPAPGDIVYFDWEPDGSPDHVGIVESCDGFYVYTIEGNSGDACRQLAYAVGSSCLYGYGVPMY